MLLGNVIFFLGPLKFCDDGLVLGRMEGCSEVHEGLKGRWDRVCDPWLQHGGLGHVEYLSDQSKSWKS